MITNFFDIKPHLSEWIKDGNVYQNPCKSKT